MSDNPHVRPIHVFQPKEELRVEGTDPRRRPTVKKSINPVAGLLDEADQARNAAEPARPSAAAPAADTGSGQAGSRSAPAPAETGRAAPAGVAPAATPAEDSVSAGPLLGEMPDVIEGDFPDPVDL